MIVVNVDGYIYGYILECVDIFIDNLCILRKWNGDDMV